MQTRNRDRELLSAVVVGIGILFGVVGALLLRSGGNSAFGLCIGGGGCNGQNAESLLSLLRIVTGGLVMLGGVGVVAVGTIIAITTLKRGRSSGFVAAMIGGGSLVVLATLAPWLLPDDALGGSLFYVLVAAAVATFVGAVGVCARGAKRVSPAATSYSRT